MMGTSKLQTEFIHFFPGSRLMLLDGHHPTGLEHIATTVNNGSVEALLSVTQSASAMCADGGRNGVRKAHRNQ
jgi:hypothetical protein